MDQRSLFVRIFGDHRGRNTSSDRLRIRDAEIVADLRARLSGLAARDNRARNSGWLIDFSPTRVDVLTERSLFDATLVSASQGERRLAVRVGRDWVELGDGAMQSTVRGDPRNLARALESAFRRAVLGEPAAAAA